MSIPPTIKASYVAFILAVLVGVAAIAACGGDDDNEVTLTPTQSAAPTPAPAMEASLSGTIAVAGSSTVFPISEAVAEEFSKKHRDVRVNVASTGTGSGGRAMCQEGTIDVWDASRPAEQEKEIAVCKEQGIELIELPVAFDALSVVVSLDNDWAPCLTVEDLKKIFGPEAQGVITNWNQVDESYPDRKVRIYGPTTASGTFDYFTDTVSGESGASRGDFTASEDDNLIIQGVSGEKNGVGYLGYAYYAENVNKLKAVEVDGGSGCVAPTDAAINNGTYSPLSRPLLIYVRKDAANEPHIAEFIRYYLSEEGQALAAEVGYIPFPQTIYDLALDKFENGTTGTVFGGENPLEGSVAEVMAGS